MADTKLTDEEFADKIDWEGGLFEATHGYGLTAKELADTDGELFHAMTAFDTWMASGKEIIQRVEAALPE